MKNEQLTQEELVKVQELNAEFNKAKMAIGDVELQKQNILKVIEQIKIEFAEQERLFIDRYGKDAVINLQTGEVTQKTE